MKKLTGLAAERNRGSDREWKDSQPPAVSSIIRAPHHVSFAKLTDPRGYVAVAVSGGPAGTISKELTTECGADRQANMVAFAIEALKLVKEVLTGSAKM